MTSASILWRRLDVPGHDACRLVQGDDEWRLEGMAAFSHHGAPAALSYTVACDLRWRARWGRVEGSLSDEPVDLAIRREESGIWVMNGLPQPGLEDCVDLDLAFTPATNLLPIRRTAPTVGQSVDAPAAWLDIATMTLTRLPQRYERRSATAYWYEAPSVGYTALLDIAPHSFVLRYPGLWEAEPG